MKYIFTLFLLVFLTACQSIFQQTPPTLDNESNVEASEVVEVEILEKKEGLADLVQTKSEDGKPIVYDNLWLKLAEGFTFEVPDNPRIAKQRDYFLKHPNHLKKISKRAEPFLYLIIEKIEDKDLPLELALLPIIESSFNPHAYSYVGAAGLWQFMPRSGERFGLHQNWWYDGRKDIYRSSDAALRYMDILHNYLGDDWLHAFAAYNSGEGRVKRSVKRNEKLNKPTDFWNLSLPPETEEYVPKLLALVDILRNHKKYGIDLPTLENKQVLSYVNTGTQLDLAYAGKLANLSVAEIQLLNPALNQWAMAPKGPHYLLLPTKVSEAFSEQLGKDTQTGWERYVVKSGDSLSVIAHKNYTTTKALKTSNKLKNNFLKIGQTLIVPKANKAKLAYRQSKKDRGMQGNVLHYEKIKKGQRKALYTVAEGDNLWDISRLYNVSVKDITQWNGISPKKPLRLGSKLTIWQNIKIVKIAVKNAKKDEIKHKVVQGDNLWDLSKHYHVSTKDIKKWNKLTKKSVLRLGQILTIKKTVKITVLSTNFVQHKVAKGDSLWKISKKYGVSTANIATWNKLKKNKALKIGRILIIKHKKNDGNKVALTYKVQKGDSLSEIAKKFKVEISDLMRWNEIKNQQKIVIGQDLRLYVKQVS